MRRQLRPFYTPEQLAAVYAQPYDHTRWPDHIERVAHTTLLLDTLAATVGARSVADLSCGDGAIVDGSQWPWQQRHLGDLATTGPLETTLRDLPPVDVYVCSETLEHVENPDRVLTLIRDRARHLLLTTPCGEADDSNPEHYWSWDEQGVEEMLAQAGWEHRQVQLFTPPSSDYYTFQIWICS